MHESANYCSLYWLDDGAASGVGFLEKVRILRFALPPLVLLLSFCLSFSSAAAQLKFSAKDANGAALRNLVLAAVPLDAPAKRTAGLLEMRQEGQQFVPELLAVQRGSQVAFPNLDVTRHHVYSFSAARRFELKLYLGEPAAPVRFDTAGIVTLGCNIHDWMLAHIVVLDTPYFAVSGPDGTIRITVPGGRYRLWAWHPNLQEHETLVDEEVQLAGEAVLEKQLTTNFVPEPAEAARTLGFPSSNPR